LIKFLSNTSRLNKLFITIFFDSVFVILILFASFFVRLANWQWITSELVISIFVAPIILVFIFFRFGLYKSIIRFIGFKTLWSLIKAISLYSLIWGIVGFMAAIDGIPRSVILINWLFSIIILGGSRVLARWLINDFMNKRPDSINIAIYGAGSSGRQLYTVLSNSSDYNPVAFIDDSVDINKKTINGVDVFLPSELNKFIVKKKIKEVFIAIPSISRPRRLEIIKYLDKFDIIVKTLPSILDLAQGKLKIDDLKNIDVKDLLGREQVKPNQKLLKVKVLNKVVLVSGAGGSIGSELCRQIVFLRPKSIILFEISESALYQIDQELNSYNLPNIKIIPVLGSIRDKKRMLNILNSYGVQTIYHAAAYKHVPLVEFNSSQGILNNAIGTKSIAEAAIEAKVETFVLISTDKAVRPTSVMGSAKRVAELVLQALSSYQDNTCFTMVRFGNVLDSSGSVIPLFRKQIKNGGPITVTHSDIVRYFMTIPEAVELVIQAGAMGNGGDVFVLDMGKPVRIHDLALKMIELSGLKVKNTQNPNGDIEIEYIGLRPGEKLYEELLVGESSSKTEHKLILRAMEEMIEWNALKPLLKELERECEKEIEKDIRRRLKKIVPSYNYDVSISK
jgi:FlaA1/EpsC-like NDP-sugar epimerase